MRTEAEIRERIAALEAAYDEQDPRRRRWRRRPRSPRCGPSRNWSGCSTSSTATGDSRRSP
ncbi:hypothetical protein [Halosegnis marinus]|uniref:hypothetical protein n=1 Tax=Halosegnis marinus TaxID=3034023 RepID=UPI003623A6A2